MQVKALMILAILMAGSLQADQFNNYADDPFNNYDQVTKPPYDRDLEGLVSRREGTEDLDFLLAKQKRSSTEKFQADAMTSNDKPAPKKIVPKDNPCDDPYFRIKVKNNCRKNEG